MTVEMTYLVWSVALTLVLAVIAVTGAMLQVGLPTLAGNRDNMPEITGWAGRAARAHRNMLESLVMFAVAIIVVVDSSISSVSHFLDISRPRRLFEETISFTFAVHSATTRRALSNRL